MAALNYKRKFNEMENKENLITVDMILQQAQRNATMEGRQFPPSKRRQTKALFRPWEDNVEKSTTVSKPQQKTTRTPKIQHPLRKAVNQNTAILRSALEQQRLSPSIPTTPVIRPNEQQLLQQYYLAQLHQQQQQYALWMEQSYRANNYLRYLQQIAMQQQQLFVFGQQH
ncbi:uncharacterized protein LOC133333301 [Musca vetustissima]|uniref:uncharacterized protein LOC133333301 n=1 Tax=Musca vetustissima TaxID=27455 RepID=UPI002AB63F49|nr:uncharacterized protein LOC133333301 [Musca vetustissima]